MVAQRLAWVSIIALSMSQHKVLNPSTIHLPTLVVVAWRTSFKSRPELERCPPYPEPYHFSESLQFLRAAIGTYILRQCTGPSLPTWASVSLTILHHSGSANPTSKGILPLFWFGSKCRRPESLDWIMIVWPCTRYPHYFSRLLSISLTLLP